MTHEEKKDHMRILFPEPPTLKSSRLILRPLDKSDAQALSLLVEELLTNRGIDIITASTMLENKASAHVLQKNGFTLVNHAIDEDWGYPELTPTDKWIR
ncbi:MAG: GNAT family N-acetyltransferase [Clostridiales bacterium]|nr:GNAT family N-acetyltransferase [Clostridiales bacterium]